MSFSRNNSAEIESKEEKDLSGCDTMKILWRLSEKCRLSNPGAFGESARANSMITCSNIHEFMRTSALKCWEERTERGIVNSHTLFTPPLDASTSNQNSANVNASQYKTNQPR
jgi:hypothetical protein